MIFELIIIALLNVLAWFFSLFSFISLPQSILDGLQGFINFIMVPFGVVSNYIGIGFLNSIFYVIIILFPVLYSWVLIKWILTRLGVFK